MDCRDFAPIVGCLTRADGTRENVVIHYEYDGEGAPATRYTDASGQAPVVPAVGDEVTAGACPIAPDLQKLLTGAAGVVAGGTPAIYTPANPIDGLSFTHCGNSKDNPVLLTFTPAPGYTISGDQTQIVSAGGTHSITFDDAPSDGDAVSQISISVIDLSALGAAAAPSLGSTLPAAPATVLVPYILNTIES